MASSNSNTAESSSSKINNIIILDGGTGREIERCGGPFRQPEWSALALYQDPTVVQRVHESFLEAGATAITTNTYAIVPFHLGDERYQKDGKRLLQLAIQLAQQARDNHLQKRQQQESPPKLMIQILGSIPPICGSYEPEKFDEAFSEPILQHFLQAFLEKRSGESISARPIPAVDVLLLETVGTLREARFYLTRIQNYHKQQQQCGSNNEKLPVWLSFCVHSEYGMHQSPTLLTGERLSDVIQILFKDGLLEQVEVLLVNCCDLRLVHASIQEVRSTLAKLEDDGGISKDIRIGAYPNAFSIPPPDAANHTLRPVDYNISPQVLQCQAAEWIHDCGATVIGGCCGVNPDHIRAIAQYCQPTAGNMERDDN